MLRCLETVILRLFDRHRLRRRRQFPILSSPIQELAALYRLGHLWLLVDQELLQGIELLHPRDEVCSAYGLRLLGLE